MQIDEEARREAEFFRRFNRKLFWPSAAKDELLRLLRSDTDSSFGTVSPEQRSYLSSLHPERPRNLFEQEVNIAERLFSALWHPDCYAGLSSPHRPAKRNRLSTPVKVWIASDLHLDVMRHQVKQTGGHEVSFKAPEEADLVILAGDIMAGVDGLHWASQLGKPVIYVPGNHEFDRGCIDEVELALRRQAADLPSVHFLHNDRVDIAGIRILGTTLWTDYRISGAEAISMSHAEAFMSDHRVISKLDASGRRRLFRPQDAQNIHFRCKKWLERQLSTPFDGPTIVVTHHLPHIRSIHPTFLGTSPINASFASDLSELIKQYDIDVWVHGHTHQTFDYWLYDTRVVCNPYGYYPSAETSDFDPEFLLDVS